MTFYNDGVTWILASRFRLIFSWFLKLFLAKEDVFFV